MAPPQRRGWSQTSSRQTKEFARHAIRLGDRHTPGPPGPIFADPTPPTRETHGPARPDRGAWHAQEGCGWGQPVSQKNRATSRATIKSNTPRTNGPSNPIFVAPPAGHPNWTDERKDLVRDEKHPKRVLVERGPISQQIQAALQSTIEVSVPSSTRPPGPIFASPAVGHPDQAGGRNESSYKKFRTPEGFCSSANPFRNRSRRPCDPPPGRAYRARTAPPDQFSGAPFGRTQHASR